MLDILPHDQSFSQLIINQIVTYYDKCYGWYKAMVARGTPHPKSGKRLRIAADLTEEAQLKALLDEIIKADASNLVPLLNKEIELLPPAFERTAIDKSDLILDRRTLAAMCLLATSMVR
jgi:exocyst complex component 4